jgi:hypothetical protein
MNEFATAASPRAEPPWGRPHRVVQAELDHPFLIDSKALRENPRHRGQSFPMQSAKPANRNNARIPLALQIVARRVLQTTAKTGVKPQALAWSHLISTDSPAMISNERFQAHNPLCYQYDLMMVNHQGNVHVEDLHLYAKLSESTGRWDKTRELVVSPF